MKLASSVAGNMHLLRLRARAAQGLAPELWPLRAFQLNQRLAPSYRFCSSAQTSELRRRDPPEPVPTPATIFAAMDVAERGLLKSEWLSGGQGSRSPIETSRWLSVEYRA